MDNTNEMLSKAKVVGYDKKSSAVQTAKLFDDASHAQAAPEQTSGTTDLKSLAEEITQSLSGFKSLRLSMDRDMKRVIVRVVDQKTDNVVRQIPGERMIDLVKQMRDLEGILVKATA